MGIKGTIGSAAGINMRAARLAALSSALQALGEIARCLKDMTEGREPEVARAEADLSVAIIHERIRSLMDAEAPPMGNTGPDITLNELRTLTSSVLNHEPVSPDEVHRMATLAEMLDVFAHDMGALPTVWAAAVRKADEVGHTEAAIAKQDKESTAALIDALETTHCIGCEAPVGGPARDMSAVLGMSECPVCKAARAAFAKARGK